MATQLLHCCICPKQPNFSDTSHLLTHVSSKGHLAHLHKLQVRSHQERSAAQQLGVYDQWFNEHDVAHMLSERMQQKEMKHAKRQAGDRRRANASRKTNLDPTLMHSTLQDEQSRNKVVLNCSSEYPYLHDAMEDTMPLAPSCSLPRHDTHLNQISYLQDQILAGTLSYPCASPSKFTESSPRRDADSTTPEIGKLKGTIWPGMDIFDSADAETQRKRNQRKDVSVLERMQVLSELVQPVETVSSPGGTLKKKRHMDDLENDSPVEGESPVVKPSTKRKRKPLTSISGNVARYQSRSRNIGQGGPSGDAYGYRPPQKGVVISKRPLKSTRFDQRGFVVFDEEAPTVADEQMNEPLPNPFLHNRDRSAHSTKTLELPPREWKSSSFHATSIYDPFGGHRSSHYAIETYPVYADDKENLNQMAWQSGPAVETSGFEAPFDDFGEGFGALAEVYAFTRNPLYESVPARTKVDEMPYTMPADYKSTDLTTAHDR